MAIRIGQRPDHGFDEPLGLLSDCHRRIEHFLGVLLALQARGSGRLLTPAERADLDAALTYFATAAPRHTADEEDSLFPRLRGSSDPDAAQVLDRIAALEDEHHLADMHHRAVDALGRRWLELGRLCPEDAQDLGAHLSSLHAMYQVHIAIEDRDVFPAARRLLDREQLATIGREMAARRGLPRS